MAFGFQPTSSRPALSMASIFCCSRRVPVASHTTATTCTTCPAGLITGDGDHFHELLIFDVQGNTAWSG